MKNLRFRQFCYAHTGQGLRGLRGWQAVGVSNWDFFKPILPKIRSAIDIPEAANLQREVADGAFQVFGLRKIGQYPALIRITDAGLTADGRPGNIFAHLLFPYQQEDIRNFYQCDILSVFSKWEGWLSEWDGAPDGEMRISEVAAPDHPNAWQLDLARSLFEEDGVSMDKLIYAAEQALHPQKPQYLLIQPAADARDEALLNLLSFLWCWLPPSKRQAVQLWIGRNKIRLPGANWFGLIYPVG